MAICRDKGYPIKDIIPVGSSQRGTFLPGQGDVDLFVRFNTMDKQLLVNFTKEILPILAQKLHCDFEIRYAQNPYGRLMLTSEHITTDISTSNTTNSFQIAVDIVATIWIATPADLANVLKISGMARTPFHGFFLENRIKGLEPEARLFKYWCKQKAIYGQGGFTGFLTELLTIIYGSFVQILQHAKKISTLIYDFHHRPKEQLRLLYPTEKIIIIDPIDPDRNAAGGIHGIIGAFKMKRFVEQAELAFSQPQLLWINYFLTVPYLQITIHFPAQITIINIDERYLRLGRVLATQAGALRTYHFTILHALVLPEKNQILLQPDIFEARNIQRRGPPISMHQNVEAFRLKHSEIWEADGYLWTWIHYPSALEIINETLQTISYIEKFNTMLISSE